MPNEAERMARATQARTALDTFLGPALDAVEAEYAVKMMDVAANEPWEAEKITKLATALQITKKARLHIEQLVVDGDIARSSKKRADEIMQLPEAARKWAIFR